MPPGNYCRLASSYGPYEAPQDPPDGEPIAEIPDAEGILGATVLLRGVAERDGDVISFEHRTEERRVVELDLSDMGGPATPFSVSTNEEFPKELTVSKTYDQLFSGVDFATYDPAALDGELLDRLETLTHVFEGTVEEAG